MLLNELLNVPFDILIEREAREKRMIGSIPVIVTDQDPKSFTRTKKRGQPMGVGIQSSAYDHKNGVVKYTDVQNDNDPAVKYINISLYNQKNPYMPKYKNVKIYQDSKGYLTMVTVAEKLSGTLSDMTPEQLNGLRKIKLSSTGQAELERNREKYRAHYQGDELDAKALGMMFRSEDKTDLAGIKHFFDDADLLKAIDIISHFADDSIDMHGGNFMFRDNGQLVILDPVFGRDSQAVRDMHDRAARDEYIDGAHETDDEFADAIGVLEQRIQEIQQGLENGMFMDIAEDKVRKMVPVIQGKIAEFQSDFDDAGTRAARNTLIRRVELFVKMTTDYMERNKDF